MNLSQLIETTNVLPEELKKMIYDFLVDRCTREVSAEFDDDFDQEDDSFESFFRSAFNEYWEMVSGDDLDENYEFVEKCEELGIDQYGKEVSDFISSKKAAVEAEVKANVKDRWGN